MDKEKAREILLLLTSLIYDCIKDAGEPGIPSGHLYAMLMGKVNLHVYQQIIDAMIATNKITSSGHLLKITGEPLFGSK